MKRALLVGINYRGSSSELKGCINDINNIYNFLINNCGFCKENIHVLTDDSQTKPTKVNIENELKWLVNNTIEYDTCVFYYSGHGAQLSDTNGDEIDGLDEVLVPIDYFTRGVIKDDWIFGEVISKVKKNVDLWMFTDCCHSGSMIDLKYTFSSLCALKDTEKVPNVYQSGDWTNKFGLTLHKGPDVVGNIYAFSGCQDREKSVDAYLNNQSQGAFTNCLLETLNRCIIEMPDKTKRYNNSLKLTDILKEVNCRLDIKGYKSQNPQLSVSKTTDLERNFSL
jgi:hypothetical protein